MLTETGRVVALDADAIWVETIRLSTCGACAAQKACGHGLLNQASAGKRGYVRVLAGTQAIENYQINDQVLISIPEEIILRGSFIAYLLPVVLMLFGAAGSVKLFPGGADVLALLGAVAGLTLGLLLVRWHGHRHREDPRYQPTLQGIAAPVLSSEPAR